MTSRASGAVESWVNLRASGVVGSWVTLRASVFVGPWVTLRASGALESSGVVVVWVGMAKDAAWLRMTPPSLRCLVRAVEDVHWTFAAT